MPALEENRAMAFFVVLAVAWVLGTCSLRRFTSGGTVENLTCRLYVGLSLSAVVSLVAGSVSLRAVQCLFYLIAALGLGYELIIRRQVQTAWGQAFVLHRSFTWFDRICLCVLGCALVFSLVASLAPVTSWDAAVAHLALPKDYARQGYISLLEGNDYSGYPHLLHSLFAYAYFESGEVGVTMLNALFGALGCAAVFALGNRAQGRRCGLIAAAVYATAPIYIDQVGAASLDLAFAGMTVAALTGLLAWYEEEDRTWLWIAAFLAGSSCGIRHTGYVVCALLCIASLLAGGPERFRAAAYFCGVVFLGAFPWLARSALLTANPFYPFFSSVLSVGRIPAEEVAAVGAHSSIRGAGLVDLAWFPWRIILRPDRYDGWEKSPGGLVLFLGVPGLFIGGKRARWLGAFGIAGGVCLFYFRQSARYLLPFFAPMMVVAGMGATRLVECASAATFPRAPFSDCAATQGFSAALKRATGGMAALLYRLPFRLMRDGLFPLLVVAFAYGLTLDLAAVHFKIPVVLGLEERDEYLERRVERYEAFAWVNQNLPADSVILTLDPRSYYIRRATYQNCEALRFLRNAPFPQQLSWLRERGITHLLLPRAYLEQAHGLQAIGVTQMLQEWVARPRHFALVKMFNLRRPRTNGTERVDIYRIRYD